jgi:hypothetical protein
MHDIKKKIIESLDNLLNYYCDIKDWSLRKGQIINAVNECDDLDTLEHIESSLNWVITLFSGEF